MPKKLCSTEKLVIITGECNLPDIDWSCYHAPNSPIYNMFIDFVNNFGFYQYVNQPTSNENILDVVMATSDTFWMIYLYLYHLTQVITILLFLKPTYRLTAWIKKHQFLIMILLKVITNQSMNIYLL